MNWLLTILFLAFFLVQTRIVGKTVLHLFGYKQSGTLVFITGYFITFLGLMIPGVICQNIHCSWSIYFLLSTVVLLVMDGLSLYYLYRQQLFDDWHQFSWKSFFRNYWLVILFVGTFTVFCIANQGPILEGGYDDHYYISKIVNNIGASQIGMEEYFTGAPLPAGMSQPLERIVTTYELSYGYFSSLFHIVPAFFCRVTITIVNYLLFAFAMIELAGNFVRKKNAQFVLGIFFLYLLPAAALFNFEVRGFKLYSYDQWQFNTAMFYGGSVVRTTIIPVILIYAKPFFRRIRLKPLFLVFLISCSYLSFSSIAVTDVAVLVIGCLIIKAGLLFLKSIKERAVIKACLYVSAVILIFAGLYIIDRYSLQKASVPDTPLFEGLSQLNTFFEVWYSHDVICRLGWIPLVLIWILTRKRYGKVFAALSLVLWFLTCTFYFKGLMFLLSINYFFVYLRLITSVQMLIMGLSGVFLMLLIEKAGNRIAYFSLSALSAVSFMLSVSIFVTNQESYLQMDYLGSGISGYGWNFGRVLDFSTNMNAKAVDEIGEYFNTLPYDNYVLSTPTLIPSDSQTVIDRNLLSGSNRIELYNDGEGIPVLNDYLQNHVYSYEEIQGYIDSGNVQYLVSANPETTEELEAYGWKPEVTSESSDYFVLLQRP